IHFVRQPRRILFRQQHADRGKQGRSGTHQSRHSTAQRHQGYEMNSTLIVRGLQKSYGARQVVSDVSLQVESGEVVGLLGPNGAGKTTSFYMIVGLVPSDGGE